MAETCFFHHGVEIVERYTFLSTRSGQRKVNHKRAKSCGDLPSVHTSWPDGERSSCGLESPQDGSTCSSSGAMISGKLSSESGEAQSVSSLDKGDGPELESSSVLVTRRRRGGRRRRGNPPLHSISLPSNADESAQSAGACLAPTSADEVLRSAESDADCDVFSLVSTFHLAAKLAGAEPQPVLAQRARRLFAYGCAYISSLQDPSLLARLLWSLGRLEVKGSEVALLVEHFAHVTRNSVENFSVKDLSSSLWGLARLFQACHESESALSSAHVLAAESLRRVQSLSAQCMSNALWAAARLTLRGRQGEIFADGCAEELCRRGDLSLFTSQGLANMMWAIAKLRLGTHSAGTGSLSAQRACVIIVEESRKRLKDFATQELSMLAWSTAKLQGRGSKGRSGVKVDVPEDLRHIEHFLVEVAEEARLRLSECSGQAISNLAWALATVDVLGHDSALGFVTEAACCATHRLSEFSPQAISNFCWALARVHVSHSSRVGSGSVPPRAVVREFMASAAVETSARMSEFAWRDLSGVIVALAHGRHKSPEASTFASILVSRAAAHCAELSTQVMLNIALSASRLGVHAEELHPMVEGIRQCTHRMNSFDMRQWAELQRKCRGTPVVQQKSAKPRPCRSPHSGASSQFAVL